MQISYTETMRLICPSCDMPFTKDMPIIVDAHERPDLIAAILDGSLHDVVCPHCEQTGQSPAPLLYHDRQNARVLLAVPPEMPEQEWRELGQTLLWMLIGALPEEQRLPYLGEVQAEAGLAGIAQVIRDEGLTGSDVEQSAPPIVLAIQDLLAASGRDELQRAFEQHPILDDPQAIAILQELAAESIKHGQMEAADGFAHAAELLEQVKTLRSRTTAPASDTAIAHGLTAEQVEELAFALLRSTTGEALLQVVDEHPELLQAWSDEVLAEWADQQRRAGKPRIADGIEARRATLQAIRAHYYAQQPVLDAVQAYLEAQTDAAIETVIVEYDALLSDAADQALEQLATAARTEGDDDFAAFVDGRRTFLARVRAALQADQAQEAE
jgi:hypothetical protein